MTEILLERDIPLRRWNCYLKKYDDRYLINCSELGNWQIRLKQNLGYIELYSLVKKQLVAVLSFRSGKHKTFFKKRLVGNIEKLVKITQEGEFELCLMFDEKNIKQLEFLLKIRKHYKISKKERENRKIRVNKSRAVRNGKVILKVTG